MSDEEGQSFTGPPPGLFDDDVDDGPSTEELEHHAPRTTDSANVDAVVAEHGRGYKFVLEWGAWIAWDGKRWGMTGARQRVVYVVMLTARTEHYRSQGRLRLLDEEKRVNDLAGQKDDELERKIDREKKLLRWHEQSQNGSRIEAATKLLEGRLQVRLAQLDRDPWLLNVANGTIDLRCAELQPHDPDNLITQITDIEWNEHARCPTWETFVHRAMGGALDLVMYLQRLIGYAITGLTTEHLLAFFCGGGRNGKSTFVQTLRTMLGEYACAAPRDLLFERKGGDGHSTELARLYGKRLAVCAEIGEHTVLDEAKVKDLTGGDAVGVRRMREDFWDLVPTHTLLISGNHKPAVRGDDLGIWRRIRLIPWTVTIEEVDVDKDLPDKLRTELAGILRWCANGTLEWRANGLQEPFAVLDATQEYREESDALGQFLAEHCVFEASARCTRKELREKYEEWCTESGHMPLGARKIAQRLKERHVRPTKVRVGTLVRDGWAGVRLRSMYEMACEAEPATNNVSS